MTALIAGPESGHVLSRMPARSDLERWARPASSAPLAKVTARELLRTALLCKLAVDLQDPRLARRAAREAAASARLLAGLDFPGRAGLHDDDDLGDELPPLTDLLEQAYGAVGAGLSCDDLDDAPERS